MQLLPDELILFDTEEHKIVLTTHRVQTWDRDFGYAHKTMVLLESISSMEVKMRSQNLYLFGAFIVLLFGVLSDSFNGLNGEEEGTSYLMISLLISAVLGLLYYFTRKRSLTVYAMGGSPMHIDFDKSDEKKVENFLFDLLKARQERLDNMMIKSN